MNLGAPHHNTLLSDGGSSGREDCWSDGATATLIEAWGDRFLKLNKGNLRQKDWQEVADAVNSDRNGVKTIKTYGQCKNRIDTVKRKYKQEKTKPTPSKWRFFNRVDSLIGAGEASVNKMLTGFKFTIKPKTTPFDDGEVRKKQRVQDVGLSDGGACRELARAILKFGEIYERIECSKQQQMMELEKQRIEFTKDLEFQRMNMLVDAQLEIVKSNRQKHFARTGKKHKSENRS